MNKSWCDNFLSGFISTGYGVVFVISFYVGDNLSFELANVNALHTLLPEYYLWDYSPNENIFVKSNGVFSFHPFNIAYFFIFFPYLN